MDSKKITIRAKAFAGEGVRTHRAMVEDGRVYVWDCVAGHYTTCHALSASAIRRILAA
jgi:hypothetical protein